MIVAIPKEIVPGECRVAATPKTVARMCSAGLSVVVQSGAGYESLISDDDFKQAGARIEADVQALYAGAGVVLKAQAPAMNDAAGIHEVELFKSGATLIGMLEPFTSPELVTQLAQHGISAFSLDCLPRIARAQAMDALSAMSTLAGYKSVLLAANALRSVLPLLSTAAGTLHPAKTLVIGAGVAGLQAIATARRLGAVVKAFDVRPAVKEQVQSLGAEFVELGTTAEQSEDAGGYAKEQSADTHRRELELIAEHAVQSDIVITTALIPAKKAPVLVTAETVKRMRRGSVIVDLAAVQGGNCELTEPGKEVTQHGVIIIGPLNLPSTLPVHASLMYANNVTNLLLHLWRAKEIVVNLDDEITRGTLITHNGEIAHQGVKKALGGS